MNSAMRFLVVLVTSGFVSLAAAQAPDDGTVLEKDIPIAVTEVAPGLFFQYHHAESNNAWLVTDDGVLVIDSRQHPRRAKRPTSQSSTSSIRMPTATTISAIRCSSARAPSSLPTATPKA